MKHFFSFVAILLGLVIAFSGIGFAQEIEETLYYLLPPSSKVQLLDDQKVINESSRQGKMAYPREGGEILTIDNRTVGVRVMSEFYEIDVKNDTRIQLMKFPSLLSGSIHVMDKEKREGFSMIGMGELMLSFQSAEFVAFVSGVDPNQKVLKVIAGEVQVEHPGTFQKASIKSNQALLTDAEGKLLIPFPFDVSAISRWWDLSAFRYSFQALPLANAGNDKRVLANLPVELDGSRSHYQTGDIFEWNLVKGPLDLEGREIVKVPFNSTNIVKPLFTPTIEGEYRFTLNITNGKGFKSNTDPVKIFVGKKYLQPMKVFVDVAEDHPQNLPILYFYKKGVMTGTKLSEKPELYFLPNEKLNRVEILKIIFENFKTLLPSFEQLATMKKEELFLDVNPNHWFAPYVYGAKQKGMIEGSEGFYRPADSVTLVEVLKIMLAAYQIQVERPSKTQELPYSDVRPRAWYIPHLLFVKKFNLLESDNQYRINPTEPLTRAEFAELLYRLENVNPAEVRGELFGKIRNADTRKGIPNADVFIYQAKSEPGKSSGQTQKGELVVKTLTKSDGGFFVSLPVGMKYFVEAIRGSDVSSNRIITAVNEEKPTKVDLEMKKLYKAP